MSAAGTRTDRADDAPALGDREFHRVADRVRAMSGIVLEPHKRQMIRSRLSRRLRVCGIATIREYLDRLDADGDPEELQQFVNTLTTNLTSLFREAHHFAHLEREVLAPHAERPGARLRIWSAGCSSGEEAYSIALCLWEVFGRIPPDALILATDIDTQMLERARAGLVPADRAADIEPRYARHLQRAAAGPGQLAVPPAAMAAISFRRLNLLERWPMAGPFDAIMCRNTMIYFAQDTKAALIDRFARLLTPGGHLYLGHSESILGEHPLLAACGQTVYRRKETP